MKRTQQVSGTLLYIANIIRNRHNCLQAIREQLRILHYSRPRLHNSSWCGENAKGMKNTKMWRFIKTRLMIFLQDTNWALRGADRVPMMNQIKVFKNSKFLPHTHLKKARVIKHPEFTRMHALRETSNFSRHALFTDRIIPAGKILQPPRVVDKRYNMSTLTAHGTHPLKCRRFHKCKAVQWYPALIWLAPL